MRKNKVLIIAALMIILSTGFAFADNEIQISSPEDLLAIPDNSDQAYALTCDIDMQGYVWRPIDFNGSFDGCGHSILNLTVLGHSDDIMQTYDGNMKVYDTNFCGMFGVLNNATVKNLNLLGIDFKCNTDEECIFAGSVAGFMENATVDNVTVSGFGEIRTKSKCFGIGGIAGYGRGMIKNCRSEMTLTCIDENVLERDEQFLGGAYAAGCIDLNDNEFVIYGFDSDHGYVHNGGLVGMYIHYYDNVPKGSLDRNKISGEIKFFEDNTNRRAYCEPYIGEVMNWNLSMDGNSQSFTRNEVYDYSINLFPHSCGDIRWDNTVTEPSLTEFGYTKHHCINCGYEFIDSYTIYSEPETAPEKSEELTPEDDSNTEDNMQNMSIFTVIIIDLLVAIAVLGIIALVRKSAEKKRNNKADV